MARLPEITPTENINTSGGAMGTAPSQEGTTLLGHGMRELAHGLGQAGAASQAHDNYVNHLLLEQTKVRDASFKRQQAQDDALEIHSKYSQLREDWSNRIIEYQKNPSTDQSAVADKEYGDYVQGMLAGASSPDVAKELEIHARGYKVELNNHAYAIEAHARARNFGATFDTMAQSAEDAIYKTKDVGELLTQRILLENTINSAKETGQIRDPETIQKLSEKADKLTVTWGEANLATSPDLVKRALNGVHPFEKLFDGVPVAEREMLRRKADIAIDSSSKMDKFALRQALQSDKTQRLMTGDGNSLNLDTYEQAFGKPEREAAERDLNYASKMYVVRQSVIGGSNEDLSKVLQDSAPKADPSDPTYHDQQEHFQEVQKMVSKADAAKKDDPFTWYAANPVYKSYLEEASDPATSTPEARHTAYALLLDAQAQDGFDPSEQKIMPKVEAEKYVTQFNTLTAVGNKADGQGVRDVLTNFLTQFGDYSSVALNQLHGTKGGQKVTPKLNPLMWHLNDPTMFRMTLDAIRKDPEEEFKRMDPKVKANFLSDAALDPNIMKYQASVYAANNGEEAARTVNGVKETWKDFARDYFNNGGKLKDASDLFFSRYTWGEHNGVVFARPREYSDEHGQHVLTDEQVSLSDGYLAWFPRRLDPSTIDAATAVNQTKYFTTDQLTKDVRSALNENTFWSTTEDETGAYLYVKGQILGAPRQVKYKDGSPVRVNFKDTVVSVPRLDFGSPARHTGNTGDTWVEDLGNFFQRMH